MPVKQNAETDLDKLREAVMSLTEEECALLAETLDFLRES